MKKSILSIALLPLFLFVVHFAKAQSGDTFVLSGWVKHIPDNLPGAKVVLYTEGANEAAGQELQSATADRKGKFELNLSFDSNYMVEISKEGYETKRIVMDTHVPQASAHPKSFTFVANLNPAPDKGVAPADPVKVFFDPAKKQFDYELPK